MKHLTLKKVLVGWGTLVLLAAIITEQVGGGILFGTSSSDWTLVNRLTFFVGYAVFFALASILIVGAVAIFLQATGIVKKPMVRVFTFAFMAAVCVVATFSLAIGALQWTGDAVNQIKVGQSQTDAKIPASLEQSANLACTNKKFQKPGTAFTEDGTSVKVSPQLRNYVWTFSCDPMWWEQNGKRIAGYGASFGIPDRSVNTLNKAKGVVLLFVFYLAPFVTGLLAYFLIAVARGRMYQRNSIRAISIAGILGFVLSVLFVWTGWANDRSLYVIPFAGSMILIAFSEVFKEGNRLYEEVTATV